MQKTTKKKKPKKKKLTPIPKLRKKLDAVFNAYIRERDGKCIICGSTEKLQCSHFYGKHARPATRWSVRNAYAMCAGCHFKHHHGTEADYAITLFKMHGLKYMVNLMKESKIPVEYTREQYILLIDQFKKMKAALCEK